MILDVKEYDIVYVLSMCVQILNVVSRPSVTDE